jgi:Heterokaryon incompatibility protein (HET)
MQTDHSAYDVFLPALFVSSSYRLATLSTEHLPSILIYIAIMELYESLPLSANGSCFRLLELDFDSNGGDADEGTIHATMNTYNFADAPQYKALSYTWGGQDGLSKIKLNNTLFPVTPNLLAALEQLRLNQSKKDKSKFWIDAICIDQSDNMEKSHQVMRMKDIYANAVEVIIWIGRPNEFTGFAFDTFERFSTDDGTQDASAAYKAITDTVDERRTAIQNFIERPYFGRVWVIQEVAAAKIATIHCGSFLIDFKVLHLAMMRMTGSGFYPFSVFAQNVIHLGHWRRSFLEMDAEGREETLDLRIFMDSRDREATHLSDKIFSLRGITHEKLAEGIAVDYSKSTERVYTDFAKNMLNVRPYLRILSSVSLQHRSMSSLCLPSWVPDWSQQIHLGCIINRYYRFGPQKLFCAAGTTTPRLTVSDFSDTIFIEGIRLDTVSSVIPVMSLLKAEDENSISVTETSLRKTAAEITSVETYPFTGEPFWRALFRTLTTDRTAFSSRIDDDYRAKFLSSFTDWELDEGQKLPAAAWAEVSKTIGQIIESKDLFVTTKGYLGLSQEGFRVGDAVCIFLGGEVPFLLREEMAPNYGSFQFLSECYVHGVMDGEVLRDVDMAEGYQLEEFSIE